MANALYHNLAESDTDCHILPRLHQKPYYLVNVQNPKYPLYFQEYTDEDGWIFTSDFSLAQRFKEIIEAIACWGRIRNDTGLSRNTLVIHYQKFKKN
jgi:hypothetical protein